MSKETKRDRFIRIAESRTNKILDMIRLLSNCSETASYEYNEDDIKKIFSSIEKELKVAKSRFCGMEGNRGKFSLK